MVYEGPVLLPLLFPFVPLASVQRLYLLFFSVEHALGTVIPSGARDLHLFSI